MSIKSTNISSESNVRRLAERVPGAAHDDPDAMERDVKAALQTLSRSLLVAPEGGCRCVAVQGTKSSEYREEDGWFFDRSERTITGTYICKKNTDNPEQLVRAQHTETYGYPQGRDDGHEGDMQTPAGIRRFNWDKHKSVFTREYYAAIDPKAPEWPSSELEDWRKKEDCQ